MPAFKDDLSPALARGAAHLDFPPRRREHPRPILETEAQRAGPVVPLHPDSHPLPLAIIQARAVVLVEKVPPVGSWMNPNSERPAHLFSGELPHRRHRKNRTGPDV